MKKTLIFLLLFCCFVFNANASYKDQLRAHWDFETVESGILLDMSGNSENGEIVGDPEIVPGVVGKCMRFSGNDYIKLFNQLFFDGECNITVTCWFKYETDPKATRQLFCISGDEPNFDPMTFQFSYGKPSDFSFEDCKIGYKAIRAQKTNFPMEFQRDKWYFLTVVLCFDGSISNLKIYIDGKLMEDVTTLSHMTEYSPLPAGKLCPTFHKPMDATIGALINYPAWNWIGCIDEMKFFTTCLSENEIKNEMDQDTLPCIESIDLFANSKANGETKIFKKHTILTEWKSYSKGTLWYKNPIDVSEGFETQFIFKICDGTAHPDGRDDGGYPGNDGFAFVLQSQGTDAVGEGGGDLCYTGLVNGFAVEFDTYMNTNEKNKDYRDPSPQHIAIKYGRNRKISAEHKEDNTITHRNYDMHSDCTPYLCKIKYSKENKRFQVFVSKTKSFPSEPLIDVTNFDINKYYDASKPTFIGFTAATGLSYEYHEIHDWRLCLGSSLPKPDCDSSYFKYQSFDNTGRLKMLGSAKQIDNKIRLTPSKQYEKGAVFRDVPVPLAEEWDCTFSFSMDDPYKGKAPDNSLPGADGISLIIHNDPREVEAIGNTGMGIAYSGIENAIAIEIDLFNNDKYQIEDMKDPNGNHIALMVNKDKGKLSAVHNNDNPEFINKNIAKLVSDNTKYYARVYHKYAQRLLRVWLSDKEDDYGEPVLDISDFDITEYIRFKHNGKAYIGIGAATGDANQTHYLHSWSLCPKTTYGKIVSSVEDKDYEQLISPNPASDMLNVRLPAGVYSGTIMIYGYMGNMLISEYTRSPKNAIDISHLPIGVYFVKVFAEGKVYDLGKFIKQ